MSGAPHDILLLSTGSILAHLLGLSHPFANEERFITLMYFRLLQAALA